MDFMNYGKYIIYLVFLASFFQFVTAQDNSDSSSDGINFSSTKEKKKSLLKPIVPNNPFLKKLNSKDEKKFFPETNMNKKSSEDFVDLLYKKTKTNGMIFCKTDWEDYFIEIKDKFGASPNWDRVRENKVPDFLKQIPKTNYERKALENSRLSKFLCYKAN